MSGLKHFLSRVGTDYRAKDRAVLLILGSIRLMAGCRTSLLNQALSVLSLSLGFF